MESIENFALDFVNNMDNKNFEKNQRTNRKY
jgi:hypothetical protein